MGGYNKREFCGWYRQYTFKLMYSYTRIIKPAYYFNSRSNQSIKVP